MVPARAKFGDYPLRLAERVCAHQHAAAGVGMEPVKQAVDLTAGVGMAKDGQSEGRLGHEHVARHRHERRAGRVGPPLVVAGNHDPFAFMLHHDLSRAEDMAGGHEAHVDLADADRLIVSNGLSVLRPIARPHDRQRLGRGEDRRGPPRAWSAWP